MLSLNNKSFFLTYSKCDVLPETLLSKIKDCFSLVSRKVVNYVVAKEKHQDGTDHRHVYADLDRPFRGKVDCRFLDVQGFHPEIQCVRSNTRVIKYCTKESDYITNMEISKKVTKEDIARKLISGEPLERIVDQYPKYLFGYSKIKTDLIAFKSDTTTYENLDKPCGIWLWGPAGSGKSTIATTRFGSYYFKDKSKWFDDYDPTQETLVLEDFDLSWVREGLLEYLKIWADRYVFRGQIKGASIRLRPKKVVVTSNRSIENLLELANHPKDDWEPYLRRFTQIYISKPEDFDDYL